ncbi:MAG: hypothetical protein ACTSRS_18005 [Candidatus Helarchaeota archaeon]
MQDKAKLQRIIFWIGAAFLGIAALFAILVLTGLVTPIIFTPTGEPLDVSPLSSALVTFLMLIVLIYVGTRILDFGLKYGKSEKNLEKSQTE